MGDKYHKYKSKYLTLKTTINGGSNSYPNIKPYKTSLLDVGDNHKINYELTGNQDSKINILYLHGGPGAGIPDNYSTFFDTSKVHVIAFDQRGCGESTPFASLDNNTTDDLVKDIEKLREHLKINKWIVTGGSWGSTLALVYAIRHPDRILGLHVAAVCLLRKSEIDWLFKEGGASCMNPKYWKEFKEHIPESERDNLVKAYYSRITSPDEKIRNEACKIWYNWELSMFFFNNKDFDKDKLQLDKVIPLACIECHYFLNNTLFEENYILNNIEKIKDIPLYISQGQYDIVCPIKAAIDLHEAVPKSILTVVNNAGHNRFEEPFKTTYIDNMEKLIGQVSNLSSPSL